MRIDPLLTNYPVRIRQVTLGVFVGISSIFYVFPRALGEAEKTAYIIKDELETFDIPQTEQIEIPEPPAKPSVPIASEDDFLDEDYDIFDTDFDDWGDWEAPPADDGGNVEFVAFDKAPKAIITIQENVEYPDIAKSMGVEGTVFVKFYIDKKGNVDPNRISIIKGIPALNAAAIAAVKKSKWKPAQQRDMRVGVYQTIPIKFELN
jgi:protein TonB